MSPSPSPNQVTFLNWLHELLRGVRPIVRSSSSHSVNCEESDTKTLFCVASGVSSHPAQVVAFHRFSFSHIDKLFVPSQYSFSTTPTNSSWVTSLQSFSEDSEEGLARHHLLLRRPLYPHQYFPRAPSSLDSSLIASK